MKQQDRLGPPPVEPFSDVAWARVERGLWARMDNAVVARAPVPPPPRRWIWIAAPALAAAAVVAIVLGTRAANELSGDGQPARVVSGAAPSSVSFGDAHVTLDAESAVVMTRDASAPSALLERGGAWFSIAPRAGRPPFVVVAGDTIVRVVGTRFRVARSEERATVAVDHGIVEVQFRGTKVAITAGQSWTSDHPAEVSSAAQTAQLDPTPTPTPAPTSVDTAVVEPPADPVTEPKRPPAVKVARKPEPAKPAPVIDVKTTELERATYERLAALEVRNPSAALAGYIDLARGTSRWAEIALFAAGRLAADRKDPRAAALLGTYLKKFPRGANADDARELLAHEKGDSR